MREDGLEVKGFEVTGDERVGEGGHLRLRRMRMRLLLSDGSRTGICSVTPVMVSDEGVVEALT